MGIASLAPSAVGSGSEFTSAPPRTLSICLVNPRFEPSYWGFDYALPLYPGDVRSTMIPGALPTLAGLVPEGHEVVAIDENVEPIDFRALARFDVVGVTGMNVQRKRLREILVELRKLPVVTVVGGPYVSVNPEFAAGLADVVFMGEADTTWPEFLRDLAAGRPVEKVYRQAEATEMKDLPKPRYDVLKVKRYASGALQFSRGCPFECEFCDIIQRFGRKPRTKRPEQVIEDLADMWRAGFHSAFIVDDNFAGDRPAAKRLLREIVDWQKAHGYPLRLSTEASVNIAEDADLLDLMYRANFRYVFVGIETPRAASLKEVGKHQNVRGTPLPEKLARIQQAGLDVHGGFIVGFDSDDVSVFDEQYRFIQDNGILLAMVGMLQAVPGTPLHERLRAAGRLDEADDSLNFVPAGMTSAELRAGHADLLRRLYTPEAFFERYFRGYRFKEYHRRRMAISKIAREGRFLPTLGYALLLFVSLFGALLRDGSLLSVGRTYLRLFFTVSLRYRRDLIGLAQFLNRCVTHWHFFRFTRDVVAGRSRLFNSG